jgi:hypothetical protein
MTKRPCLRVSCHSQCMGEVLNAYRDSCHHVHHSFGYFCYVKMMFGVKNTMATFQWCMWFCFKEQIGHNLKVYVNNIVIKSRKGCNLISDLEETFINLRRFNIMLNPKNAPLESPEGCTWCTSSPNTASKQALTKPWPSLRWDQSRMSRTFNDSWVASQPSAGSCPN